MISILIPVYNVDRYIQRCLASVAAQTYSGDMECIIVDDCGQDRSLELATDFIARNDSPIQFRIIRHEHNRGLAAARNTGVENSSGDFVMHLDSDDWLEPDAIEVLVKKQQETNADIISGNAMAHYNSGVKLLAEPNYANNMEMVRTTIRLTLDHVIWRRLIRKSLYTANDIRAIEGVNIGEDHHTLPRLAFHAQSIAKVDKIIYHYNCINPDSFMARTKTKINLMRYDNDWQSIHILKEFFCRKDKAIAAELDIIKENYEHTMRMRAIAAGDRAVYSCLCGKQGITPHYFISRIRFFIGAIATRIKSKF